MKKVIAIVLLICMSLHILSGCTQKEEGVNQLNNEYTFVNQLQDMPLITRGEWIEILGQTFGMMYHSNVTPYFDDIGQNLEIYDYVQACYEWDILKFEGNEFLPNELATKTFVATTAVLATGILDSDDVEDYKAFALEKGIVWLNTDDWNEAIIDSEADIAVSIAQDVYLSIIKEPHSHVVIADDIEDFTKILPNEMIVEGTTVIISSEKAGDLEVGSVFIAPADETSVTDIPMKVVSITQDGDKVIIETETPKLEEFLIEASVYEIVEVKAEDFTFVDGVNLISGGTTNTNTQNGYIVNDLVYNSKENLDFEETNYGLQGFSLSVNLTKGKVSLQQNLDIINDIVPVDMLDYVLGDASEVMQEVFEDTTLSISTPFITEELTSKNVYKKELTENTTASGYTDYNIVGTIKINDLSMLAAIETSAFSVDELELAINSNITHNIKVSGAIGGDIVVGFATLPIGVSGFSVDLELGIYVDINGEVSVGVTIGNYSKIEYSNGIVRQSTTNSQSAELQAKVSASVGVKVKLSVAFLVWDLVDVTFKAGILGELTASIEKGVEFIEELNVDNNSTSIIATIKHTLEVNSSCKGYAPIITLSIGASSNYLKNLRADWSIIKKEDAPKIYTVYDVSRVFWEYIAEVELTIEELEELKELENVDEVIQNNQTYRATLEKSFMSMDINKNEQITISNLPENISLVDVEFTSKNHLIASVDQNGKVYAIGEGVTQIFIILPDGQIQVCAIMVTDAKEKDYQFLL